MSLKPKVEAIIYAAEEPVSVEQIAALLKEAVVSESSEQLTPAQIKAAIRSTIDELIADYSSSERAMEIRQVAGGYRMATKPEHHDVVRGFAKSLKPPVRLSLQALETLAVIAYKQPVTVPEISEIRGVDSSGVIATLLDRKLITTGGRKAVVGRPILYKTTKEFLMRFGLSDVGELPSMEEFEKLAGEALRSEGFDDVFDAAGVPDATGVPDVPEAVSEAVSEAHSHSEDANPGDDATPLISRDQSASQDFSSPAEDAVEDESQEGFPGDIRRTGT